MGKVIHWELCKKFISDHTNKWYIHNPESVLRNETHTPLGFWNANGSRNLSQTTGPYNNQQQQQKRVLAELWSDYKVKLKENEKKDKYQNLAGELKKLWNMKVTVIPIVIGALGIVAKGLLKGLEGLEIRGRVETVQVTALLRSARILKRDLETWGDLLSLSLPWKAIN